MEMILLSHTGWSPGSMGIHLGYCTTTIRGVLHQFQAEGIKAIRHRPRGPAPDTGRRIQAELNQLLSEERTWSSRQLNVMAAMISDGRAGSLVWSRQPRPFRSEEFVKFLRRTFSEVSGLKVVVVDNYSIHRSKVVKEVCGILRRAGIILYYLPPIVLNSTTSRECLERSNITICLNAPTRAFTNWENQ